MARELQRRLELRGLQTVTLRFRDLLPLRLGAAINRFYRWMIIEAPWLYEFIYRLWLRPDWRTQRTSPIATLAGRRLERVVRDVRPSVVVSLFHVCSQTIGTMRSSGVLEVPAASLVLDFAAHATWVNPGVDVHLCLHPSQAARVRALGAPRVEVPGPVVEPRFLQPCWRRNEARRTLGIGDCETVVLVVAGSWGAGEVEATARALAGCDQVRVLVATGRNTTLLRSIEGIGSSVQAIGWVDDVERLIAAADVVVENAGGLTAMEAMAMGRPVISYRPIAGHGADNVRYMEEAGVTAYARSEAELLDWVRSLSADSPERRSAISRGRASFRGDAARCLEEMIPK